MVKWAILAVYLAGYIFEFQSCYNVAKQEIDTDTHEPALVAAVVAIAWPFLFLAACVLAMIDGVSKRA